MSRINTRPARSPVRVTKTSSRHPTSVQISELQPTNVTRREERLLVACGAPRSRRRIRCRRSTSPLPATMRPPPACPGTGGHRDRIPRPTHRTAVPCRIALPAIRLASLSNGRAPDPPTAHAPLACLAPPCQAFPDAMWVELPIRDALGHKFSTFVADSLDAGHGITLAALRARFAEARELQKVKQP